MQDGENLEQCLASSIIEAAELEQLLSKLNNIKA